MALEDMIQSMCEQKDVLIMALYRHFLALSVQICICFDCIFLLFTL